jgi:hypothetical protein
MQTVKSRNLIDRGGENMRQQRMQKLLVASVALFMLSLGFSHVAWARGDHGGVGGRGFPGGVLQQLIFPCQAECRDSAQACGETATSEGVTCIQSACTTQVQAAQTACAADRTAQVCKDAVGALRTCGESCLTTFQTAASACRDTAESCRDACDLAQ